MSETRRMMRSPTCPKCQGSMAEGFVAHERTGVSVVNGWREGAPQKRWWGLKMSGKSLDIATWRCQRCGFLENYAHNSAG